MEAKLGPFTTLYDVIVVGAGIEGSSCAYNLAKAGKKTLLLEQFPLPHTRGSSHGQSRITRYMYPEAFYVRMMLDAFPMWKKLQQEFGQEIFVNCGVLDLRVNAKVAEPLLASMKNFDIPIEFLSSKDLRKRFPAINVKDEYTGVFDPNGGVLRADRCIVAFQKVFKDLGGIIHDDEEVLEILPGNPVRVKTARSNYTTTNVVLATGCWTEGFSKSLGLNLPLRTIRVSPMYWKIQPGQETIMTPDKLPCILKGKDPSDKHDYEIYIIPCLEYPGLVKVCHHDGPSAKPVQREQILSDDSWLEPETTATVKRLFPGLEPKPAIIESCMYTMTPDVNAFIDKHPKYPNIVVCAGFSGHGFKLAPVAGKAVKELILNEKSEFDMKQFSLTRFDAMPKL